MKALAAGVDVLVATPGRLMDHMAEKVAILSGTEIFVLDEADQMLDLGFVVPIRKIASQLTKKRQNLFFSATMPSEIGKLAGELLNNPVQGLGGAAGHHGRAHRPAGPVHRSPAQARRCWPRSCSSPASSAPSSSPAPSAAPTAWPSIWNAAGIEAASIHGDKTPGQRERALAAFKAGEMQALVATDIAARGIDVNDVSHVINYELPNVPEAYVHRIGRTARKGKDGIAISFCADDERNLLKDIQKATRQTIPSFDRRNDKQLAAAAAVADKLAPAEKYVDPRKADPRNDVPSELRRKRPRNRNGGGGGRAEGGQKAQGRGPGGNKGGAKPGQKPGSTQNQFRGPKRQAAPAENRWSPID